MLQNKWSIVENVMYVFRAWTIIVDFLINVLEDIKSGHFLCA